MIRVLVVDDSAVVRQALRRELEHHADIRVVGAAADAYQARELIALHAPDVVTLDIEMPGVDGLSFLRALMRHHPLPVVVVSSLTPASSETALRALALGAVDVVCKATGRSLGPRGMRSALTRAVRIAARARVTPGAWGAQATVRARAGSAVPGRDVIAIGASTGGARAIEHILSGFPGDTPATLVVQHLPPAFTASFAARLDRGSPMEVREAREGDVLRAGLALVAPGDRHMAVRREGRELRVRLGSGPPIHHQRPAVDVLFHSLALAAGSVSAAALLTGMGVDGARGMLALRESGALTVAEDASTCVVHGMPREAVALGAASVVAPLHEVCGLLLHAGIPDPAPAG